MPTIVRESLLGARSWVRQPLFLLTTVLVLGIGLAANLTIFSLVNGLILKPITPDHAERLVALYSRDTTQRDNYRSFSLATYAQIAADKTVFDDVLGHAPSMVGVAEGETTRRVFADFVSANFFSTLGTPLAIGRAFSEAESAASANVPVVVIGDALWNRLGRPADVLDRSLRINGRAFSIIGVAPPSFTGTTALASPELWLPFGAYDATASDMGSGPARALGDAANHPLFLIGRLKPGVTLAAANDELRAIGPRIAAERPDEAHQELLARPAPRLSISTRPANEAGFGIAALLLLAVATVVLVIACLNAATLLLSRGMARRRDIAVRLALGASRWQLVRSLLLEGLLAATLACAIGIVLAYRVSALIAGTIQAIAPLPIVFDPRPDLRTLAAAAGWTALSTIVFALGPAWKLTRTDIVEDLQRRPTFVGGGGWRRWRSATNLLVVAQIALSLVLLTTAGVFLRGARQSLAAPLGFALEGEVIATIDPALGGYAAARGQQLDLAAVERVRAIAGIETASIASTIPFGDTREGARIAAVSTTRRDETVATGLTVVGHDYFRTLAIELVNGRDFSEAEERGTAGTRVAIVDRLAAARLWPGADPIGRTVYRLQGGAAQPLTVVGVVAPTRLDLIADPAPALYVPFGQEPRTTMTVHARVATGSADAMLPTVRAVLVALDPRLPILKLATLRTVRDESPSMWMMTTSGRIFGTLGFLAALLAVTGLYAVVAYLVARRVKEIGIRIALGAGTRGVLMMVVRDGAALTSGGLAIGMLLSAGTAQAVRSVASSVATIDATVFAVPPLLLAAAALAASLVPARRAARLAPLDALRQE